MHRPQILLERQRVELARLCAASNQASESNYSHNARTGEESTPEQLVEAFPDSNVQQRSQVLLSRNGVGKTTLLNNIVMLGEDTAHTLKEAAPRRYVRTQHGRSLQAVSEAVAEVITEEETLDDLPGRHIKYIRNPQPDANLQQQQLQEQELTISPVKNWVFQQLEAHMQRNSFLLRTGSPDSTTTNSITKLQYGHIPGAIERFKSLAELQSDAYAFVLLHMTPDSDRESDEYRQLFERFCAITGQTAVPTPLPAMSKDIMVCEAVQAVAGVTHLYSGHDESSTSFRCFLRERLTANQPLAPKHVALDTTTVFLPCIALEVPFIDTPGTGDTDVLNEFVTQAAMDDAIHDSSQILLCGTKSFKAEATVGPLVIQYMQHMITSTSDTPCIRGVLLPETSGRYTHKAVCSEADQQTCHDRVNTSLDQLQKWMQLANQKLPQQHRADPARLKVLLGRCEVRVVYMNLYASLCHQAPGDLKALADDVSSTERPVTAEKLLDNTGGPWLLGLSTQLAAQAVLPVMESLNEVHLEQLVGTLRGRLTNMDIMLSAEAQVALGQQCRLVKKSADHLKLRHDNMFRVARDRMAQLKRDMCVPFVTLGEACKADCAAQDAHIKDMWKDRLRNTAASALARSFVKVSAVYKTAAYRTTFCHTGIVGGMNDTLHQVQQEVQGCLSAFAEQHVLAEIVKNIDECLEVKLPQADRGAVKRLVQQVAERCIKPRLDGEVNRFVKRLMNTADLKTNLRAMQEKCVGTHLLKGDPSSGAGSSRAEVPTRVSKTLEAAQQQMPKAFEGHVHTQVQAFVDYLTRAGAGIRYQGFIVTNTKKLVHEVMLQVSKDAQIADSNSEDQQLYHQAVEMQKRFQEEIDMVKKQATNPLSGDVGLAASLHSAARLGRELQQHPDLHILLDAQPCAPTLQILLPQPEWVNVAMSWEPALEMNLTGSLKGNWEHRLLCEGLGLPAMTDSEWGALAPDSLPASLQHQLWPTDQLGGAAQSQRMWQAVRVVIAFRLVNMWSEPEVQALLRKMQGPSQAPPEFGEFMKRIQSPGQPLGMLELLAFMTSHATHEVGAPGFTIQLWIPGSTTPTVLSNPLSGDDGPERTRRRMAYNLLLVTLPQSQKLVWLPLVKRGYTDITHLWSQRLTALDQQKVAVAAAIAADTAGPSKPRQEAGQSASLKAQLQGQEPQGHAHSLSAKSGKAVKRKLSSGARGADHSRRKR